ncbi:MAG TPA: hypothetical protein VGX28_08705 [Frankiaceae bacterium]|nr:hypothetical protein [Frankiaceae bacterium]
MRRLLVLPLLAAAAFAAPAAPASADVSCHGVYSGSFDAGVCAGIVCVDLCGPRLVLYTTCSGAPSVAAALCAAVDHWEPLG